MGVLTAGGNAVDAAVAALFALSVVEPMMVSPFGSGFFVIRDRRSGAIVTIDNYATVPAAPPPHSFEPDPDSLDYLLFDNAHDIVYRAISHQLPPIGWAIA